jgi:amidase
MSIERPNPLQLQQLAHELHLQLSESEAAEYLALMQPNFDAYDLIDGLQDEIPALAYPRDTGYRPEGDENLLNAWYYKSEVQGAPEGKLAGKPWYLRTIFPWLVSR